jgi:regulator of sigma E protease
LIFFAAFQPDTIAFAAFLFLITLVPLVFIHELGHFIAAKLFGIKVLEFGFGFPPRIKGLVWRKGETEYTINWLPIGGFVRLLGEEDPTDPRSLAAAARWKRLTVMAAGVIMNVVLAVALFTVGYMVPRERSLSEAQVTEVAPGSPAAEAKVTGEMRDGSVPLQGIQPGDLVREVQGREVRNTQELIYNNRLNLGETQTWVIVRQGSTLSARVYARWHPPAGEGPTGIRVGPPQSGCQFDSAGEPVPDTCQYLYPFTESVSFPIWKAIPKGFVQLVDTLMLAKNEMRVRLFGGGGGGTAGSGDVVQGPVGIAAVTGDIVGTEGWRPVIDLLALFSLNLAIFNALPIPMLDGGRMFFVIVEMLRGGRRIAPEKESLVHLTGFALMMVAVVIVTFLDIQRLVS